MAQQRPDYLLSDYNIYTYDIVLVETSGTAGAAAYDAELEVNAVYAQRISSRLPSPDRVGAL